MIGPKEEPARDGRPARASERPRALVLHPCEPRQQDQQARLEEAVGLARALELDVVGALTVPLRRRQPATLLGEGKVAEVGDVVAADQIELVIVDGHLSPVQQRNLERRWKAKVIDRTGLILEIFGDRAKTREGVMQVELAALSYQRSRLVRSWTHLERQRGGFGFLGGPGESQIELDRRRIGERIAALRRELDEVRRTRRLHRVARARVPYPVLALVGYTNAGKSTLFNRITGAGVVARDQLFATLDPTMRLVRLPSGRKIILSDTVGFVSDLPTMLVAAFRATLEEVLAADLILHVRDISHPDSERQAADVAAVLAELGIDTAHQRARIIEVWNKMDRLGDDERERIRSAAAQKPGRVAVSAIDGAGVEGLLREIDRRLSEGRTMVDVRVDHSDGALLAWLHQHGEVLGTSLDEQGLRVTVALDETARSKLDQRRSS